MTSSSKKSASKAKLLDKRKLEDDLETKPILKKHKENETRKEQNEGRVELSETNYVGQVVRLRLVATHTGKREGSGFVEFASANEAKKVLEKKNGEYLRDRKIILQVANKETTRLPLKYCVEHTVSIDFFKDVGQVARVRLRLTPEGKRTGRGFVEFASADEAKKALEKKNGKYLHKREIFLDVANKGYRCLPPNIKVFEDVGEVVSVRLVVDDKGERVDCCFVEFASAEEAKLALQEKKNSKFFRSNVLLKAAEIASPYPFRPKRSINAIYLLLIRYNLHKLAKKLWYEDNILRREGLGLVTKEKVFVTMNE
ncbi:unnamed protein product [Thlaspi arvense]|uniref:RRM domain-containing protein n=1 Tax=Thlaspi arvense TaxID=13288 RepID=A0AAU9SIG6_THLAR|nr:unnamed protein product [Thlaspi arvense]